MHEKYWQLKAYEEDEYIWPLKYIWPSTTDIFLRHLSEGKLHKILLFVSLIKPANKEGLSLAMQMSSEMFHLFSSHCNTVHPCRKFCSEEFYIYINACQREMYVMPPLS